MAAVSSSLLLERKKENQTSLYLIIPLNAWNILNTQSCAFQPFLPSECWDATLREAGWSTAHSLSWMLCQRLSSVSRHWPITVTAFLRRTNVELSCIFKPSVAGNTSGTQASLLGRSCKCDSQMDRCRLPDGAVQSCNLKIQSLYSYKCDFYVSIMSQKTYNYILDDCNCATLPMLEEIQLERWRWAKKQDRRERLVWCLLIQKESVLSVKTGRLSQGCATLQAWSDEGCVYHLSHCVNILLGSSPSIPFRYGHFVTPVLANRSHSPQILQRQKLTRGDTLHPVWLPEVPFRQTFKQRERERLNWKCQLWLAPAPAACSGDCVLQPGRASSGPSRRLHVLMAAEQKTDLLSRWVGCFSGPLDSFPTHLVIKSPAAFTRVKI